MLRTIGWRPLGLGSVVLIASATTALTQGGPVAEDPLAAGWSRARAQMVNVCRDYDRQNRQDLAAECYAEVAAMLKASRASATLTAPAAPAVAPVQPVAAPVQPAVAPLQPLAPPAQLAAAPSRPVEAAPAPAAAERVAETAPAEAPLVRSVDPAPAAPAIVPTAPVRAAAVPRPPVRPVRVAAQPAPVRVAQSQVVAEAPSPASGCGNLLCGRYVLLGVGF